MPLLQVCAAMLDQPLILYTAANPTDKLQLPPEVPAPTHRLIMNGSPSPAFLYKNPIDLDVWLGLGAAQALNQSISNRELLKKIGDTVGSHRDIDIIPFVELLTHSYSELASISADSFVRYIHMAGAVSAALAEQVIHKNGS